jgi:OHCU decarboxylase
MERWERVNAAPPHAARAELEICCGAERWVDRMMARRPFASRAAALSAARAEWFALRPADWLEAFDHHPRIGESRPANGTREVTKAGLKSCATGVGAHTGASHTVTRVTPATPVAQDFSPASVSPASAISAREQAGVADAGDDVKAALAAGNREYEQRFGYIYIVCAAGKSAPEMLSILQSRLTIDPDTEIRVAAEEHAKICELRLCQDVAERP